MENPVRMEELKSEQCLQRDVLDLRHHQDDVGVFDYVLKTYFSKIEIFEWRNNINRWDKRKFHIVCIQVNFILPCVVHDIFN